MDANYTRWELVNSPDAFSWDEVVYDGYGYVILQDGSRLDVRPDLYREEREAWNAGKRKKKENSKAR